MNQEAFDFLNQTVQIIYEKNVNILAFEMLGGSFLAEGLLIAEGHAILKNFVHLFRPGLRACLKSKILSN